MKMLGRMTLVSAQLTVVTIVHKGAQQAGTLPLMLSGWEVDSVLTSARIAALGDLPLDDDYSLCYSNILKGMYKSNTILSKQVHAWETSLLMMMI